MKPDKVTEALLALQKGNFSAACMHIRSYNTTHPREAQHFLIEGLACLAMADWPAAHHVFESASTVYPTNSQFWFNRGLAEENLGLWTEAENSYQNSLTLKPEQGEIFGNLSNIYRRLGRFPEAVQMACRALAAGVPKAHALNILGLALGKQGNFSEAQKAFDEALAIAPHEAAILANRANLAVDQLKFDEAWGFFAKARELEDAPSIRRDEGMARMLSSDYETGLPLYEARLELPGALRVRPVCKRWQNQPLAGKKLLLISEQGYGDTIQFFRYADRLVEMGAQLVWMVQQPLLRLMRDNAPGNVITENDPLPDCDYWLPVLSLPFALNLWAASAQRSLQAATQPLLPNAHDGKRKIGLVWQGSPTHQRDHERSIPLDRLAAIWHNIDAKFYAPFKEARTALQSSSGPIEPLDHLIEDFADMAALLKQLDCLVTVDTAAAHLAGALGIKTYLLLQHCPDWRWSASSETTVWYPSMTLLRQPRYGHWDSVIGKLIETLTI